MSAQRDRGTPANLGILAAIGVAACCGLPLLIGAGALGTVGTFLRSPAVVAAGAALFGGFAWRAFARRRQGARCRDRGMSSHQE